LRIENNKRKNFGEGKIMAHMSNHNTFQKKTYLLKKKILKPRLFSNNALYE
jgi:hypothetical protein